MTNTNTTLTSSPSVFYAVDGSPDDYRFVLRGADLVLIDHGNVEHVFLFVGNIMSVDGQVEMRFSSGATLHAEDLFKRAELIDLQTFYEEELEWDATNEEGEQKEGNTPLPDGQDVPQSDMEAKDIQAAPVQNLKQQLMQALQENDNTGRQIFEEIPNRNRWLVPNTNTSDKQGSADDVKPGEVPRHLLPPKFALTDDTNSGSKLDEVTNFTRPHFEGTADPEASVTLYVNNSAVATTTASTTGKFIFQFDQPLADGNYSVYVQSSKYGLTARSETAPLVIDTTSPLLPSIRMAPESDFGFDNDDSSTRESRPVFEGQYAPGQAFEEGQILILEARTRTQQEFGRVGEAVVQADGSWSTRLDTALPHGWGQEIRLSAEDTAGNKALPGAPLKVTIDTVVPYQCKDTKLIGDTFNPAMAGTDSDFVTSDRTFGLSGSAEAWNKVRVHVQNVLTGEKVLAGVSRSILDATGGGIQGLENGARHHELRLPERSRKQQRAPRRHLHANHHFP